ncbi:hypothetical protein Tco_1254726 [Tanacetum coccineum]
MAPPQRQADVHQDELCPVNKPYALMDANKKIDLHNPLCPNERKILANILQNHPIRFSIEDGSKYRLSFVLDRKALIMTLDDFKTIFQLPQATDNNLERFIMQMLYCFVNNVHDDYADLLWEGLHYSHFKEHLVAEEIEKMVEGTESEESDEVDNSILNSQNDPDTRLDPGSYKESLEVEKTVVAQPVNIIEEEEESAEDDYELRRRVKGKNVDESRNTPSLTTIRSLRIHSTLISSDTKKLQELMVTDPTPLSSTPSSSSSELSATE